MDTAKRKVPKFASEDDLASEEEQTGIFRRLEYPAAPRSNQSKQPAPNEKERLRKHEPAGRRAEDSAQRREHERRRRHEETRHAKAPESGHSEANLEVGSLGTNGLGGVTYDAKGDPVWEWRVDVPRRREDDPTIDLLKCLDVGDLRLEDETNEPDQGINPYDTARVRLRK